MRSLGLDIRRGTKATPVQYPCTWRFETLLTTFNLLPQNSRCKGTHPLNREGGKEILLRGAMLRGTAIRVLMIETMGLVYRGASITSASDRYPDRLCWLLWYRCCGHTAINPVYGMGNWDSSSWVSLGSHSTRIRGINMATSMIEAWYLTPSH